MEETLDMPLLVDGDDFSEARGRRKKRPAPRRKRSVPRRRPTAKRRPSANERSVPRRRPMAKRRPSANERSAPMARKRPSPSSEKYIDTENSAIARYSRQRPSPKRSSVPQGTSRSNSQEPPKQRRKPKTTPLPEGLGRKQGVMANKEQSTKNNKMLWIAGGLVALGLVAFLIIRKKK
jgi:uncharacterized membrane protein